MRITDFVKTAQLEQKWQQKKIEISAAKSKDVKRADDWFKNKRIDDIKNKMKSGRRLSHDEKEFLRIHAPDLYEKAMKIERERDEFRRALAKCKTKEEARRLQTAKALELQTEAQAMSCKFKDGGKDESEFIAMRMMAIFDEFADFVKSKEYADIPNEHEENDEEIENIIENSGKDEKSKKSKFKKAKATSNEEIVLNSYKLNATKILNRPYNKFISSTSVSPAIKTSFANSVTKP
jgi:ABC-type transport system involved in cytochrome bd biosynthesis fused ATPase/permease subunit